jgi:hypothetical protein
VPRFRIAHRQNRTLRLVAWLSARHAAFFRSTSHAAILAGLGLTAPPPRRFFNPIPLDVPIESDPLVDDVTLPSEPVDESPDWAAVIESADQTGTDTGTIQVSNETRMESPPSPVSTTSIERERVPASADAISDDALLAPVLAPTELVAELVEAAGASRESDPPRQQSSSADEVDRSITSGRDASRSELESRSDRAGRHSRIEEIPPVSTRQQASHDRPDDRPRPAGPGDSPRAPDLRADAQSGQIQAGAGSDTRRGGGSPPEPPPRVRHSNAPESPVGHTRASGDVAAPRSASRSRQDESPTPRSGVEPPESGVERASDAARPSQAAIPPPPSDPADLFTPRTDAKRSPQRWFQSLNDLAYRERTASEAARRGRQHGEPAETGDVRLSDQQPARPAARATASRPPAPLPDSARRFLTPLVGVDQATVRIHQGETGDQVAREHQANAVTISDDIYLSAGQSSGSPETLGLLAHEITHVAQQRNLRFVPPVIRDRSGTGRPPAGTSSASAASPVIRDRSGTGRPSAGTSGASAASGEDQALAVEGAVRALARSHGRVFQPPAQRPGVQSSGSTGIPPSQTTSHSPEGAWDGLPAPWEPLPDWMNQPALSTAGGRTTPSPHTIVAQTAQDHAQPAPQRAARDRAIDEPPADSGETGARGNQKAQDAVEPDLDELARQVYGVLRRKLAAERRRMG